MMTYEIRYLPTAVYRTADSLDDAMRIVRDAPVTEECSTIQVVEMPSCEVVHEESGNA